MRLCHPHPFLLAFGLLLVLTLAVPADNWPQWRGPTHDGLSTETGLPTTWSDTQNVLWKLPLPGMAGSTPVIWGDRIFLTSADGNDLVLLCASTDGKELWKRKLGQGNRVIRGNEGNLASASPSTDGKHVWAFVGSGDLACFDFDGKEVWKFNTQDRYGRFDIQFGLHSTPVLHGDRLYLQFIHSGGGWVVAVDKATGKDIWKVKRVSDVRFRSENEHSYASPCLWQKNGDAYLITHGQDYAIAHRLSDGGEIWRLTGLNPKERYHPTLRFVSSPVATPDLVVVPTAKRGPVVAVKPDASGTIEIGGKGEAWRKPSNTPDVSSPLVHDGLVYLCGEQGTLYCVDAKTGQELYAGRLHSARYRASPVYADGKIYLTARDGYVTVVKAGPKFEKLAENRLSDEISASPVICGGCLYLRGFSALYAIGQPK